MKASGLADSPLFQRKAKTNPMEDTSVYQEEKHEHDSIPSRQHASIMATVSKSVCETGKEVCTYRLTQREKIALVETIYYFRMRTCRLSENEIARIAINFILEDFKIDKKASILSTVIDSMKA